MKDITVIKLTEDQIKELGPLQKEVEEAYEKHEPGAILGQVSPTDGTINCMFCTNHEIITMYHALGLEPPTFKG